MRISLRVKVFLPLLILMALLIGYLYLSWMPRSVSNIERQWEEAAKRHLDSVAEGMIPLLLGRELDTIHENFNELLKKNRDWTSIQLTDATGRLLYPIRNRPMPDAATHGQDLRTLTKRISYLDMNLGTLTMTVDLSPHLKEWKKEFYNAVSIMVAIIAATILSVGIVLERKVVQPVKALELATQKLADGKFNVPSLKADDDEVGHLVDSFSTMRANLSLSYDLLRQSRDKYSTLYNETPVLLHTVDEAGTIIEVNDFWLKKLGYERDEVLGRKATDFLTEESRKYAAEVVLPVFLHCGFCKDISYQFVKKNGELEDVLLSATAERDEKGNIVRCFTVIEDVTDRKKIENKLILSEQTNKIITSTAKDAIIMVDDRDCVLFWNPAAENILGYTEDEMLGRSMHETLASEGFREKYTKGMETFRNSGKGNAIGHTIEVVAKNKDGTEFPIALSLSTFQMNNRWHAVGIVRDITQQKLAEKMRSGLIRRKRAPASGNPPQGKE
ncbi:hypothetical protein NBG4_110028 [Candidatus Sulfobium mesophilum]|uniref:Histidine kinase n=1 Tax=Candidatus Sulfobium mesophilum TaxID=2016548 RepID=A0A2U3QEF3_9BACT|nr:hypothetical protein NBG4_110028 [Candidatus Sulfobium mesophilum]